MFVKHELGREFVMPLKTNHLALKSKLYVNALQSTFQTLHALQPVRSAV